VIDWIASRTRPTGIKTDFQHLSLWDSLKADAEIHRILKLASRYGPIDHIEAIRAEHWFPGNAPFGVAIEPAETFFNCAIVLNAGSNDYFGKWSSSKRFSRLMWLLEAYFETLDARRDFEAGDRPGRRYAYSPSPLATLSSMVVAARSSYVIDKKIDRALAENLSDHRGKPLRLSFVYSEGLARPALEAATDNLDNLLAAVRKEAEPVLIGREPDVMGVWVRCAGHIWGMLAGLARLAAAYDHSPEWSSYYGRLSANETFAALFADAWPALHGDWRAAAVGEGRVSRRADPDCVAALRPIFQPLGITILDGNSMCPVEFFRVGAGTVE
jgi:hypothetical protein